MLALAVNAFLLIVFTVAACAVGVSKPSAALPVLITFYFALGVFWFANNWMVQRNLQSSDPAPHAVLLRSEFPHVCVIQTV